VTSSRSAHASRHGLVPLLVCLLLAVPGVAHAAPPANDDFADAAAVTEPLPFTTTADTSEATYQSGEPALKKFGCGFIGATVWYAYTPSADTIVGADTIGSDFDTIVAVWEGTDLGSLTLVGCNDDARGGLQSSVPFLAEAGVEYRIQVGGYGADTGSLSFRVREVAAGFVTGTVTNDETADPLEGICVFVADAVFPRGGGFSLTGSDGTYNIAVRPGEYIVLFLDCQFDSFVPEYWEDVATDADATEISVADGATVTGIDAALVPSCPGWGSSGFNQVVGTSDDDTLTGTADVDVACGFGGNDTINGVDARDFLFGGAGEDELFGNLGNDILLGGGGRDSLFGGPGRDELTGGRGRDECDGGPGRDRARSCEVERRI
jgi:hypothetical protein